MSAASSIVLSSVSGHRLNEEERKFFKKHIPAGVTLFSRNIPNDYTQTQLLCREILSLPSASEPPLMIAIDQEGGRVRRIKGDFPNLGPALDIAQGRSDLSSLALIEEHGVLVGRELIRLGINVNFAPVLDILSRSENTAIGDRVWGTDPETVVKRAGAYLKGLQSTGVFGCLKHFPGQGDAPADTHYASARIDAERDLLERRELRPFTELVPKCHMVMLSHCIYQALDPEKPASQSRMVANNLLRVKLQFSGLVVSDDMLMEAVTQDQCLWMEQIVATIAAGVDLVLVCKDLERSIKAVEAIETESRKSKAFSLRVNDASQRVLEFRRKLKKFKLNV